MKPAYALAGASVVAMIVAIAKPEVAHLAFQAILVTALAVVVVTLAIRLAATLPKSPYATGWRPVRRARPELPREISSMIDGLGIRQRSLPISVTGKVAQLFEDRLSWRHGLSPIREADLPAIHSLLSPTAYALVTARQQVWMGGKHPHEGLPRQVLEPLITELERL